MTPQNNDRKRWLPRFRLRQLFTIITVVAVLVWLWPRLGFDFHKEPKVGTRIILSWNGKSVTVLDTFPRPQPGQYYDAPMPSTSEEEERLGIQ